MRDDRASVDRPQALRTCNQGGPPIRSLTLAGIIVGAAVVVAPARRGNERSRRPAAGMTRNDPAGPVCRRTSSGSRRRTTRWPGSRPTRTASPTERKRRPGGAAGRPGGRDPPHRARAGPRRAVEDRPRRPRVSCERARGRTRRACPITTPRTWRATACSRGHGRWFEGAAAGASITRREAAASRGSRDSPAHHAVLRGLPRRNARRPGTPRAARTSRPSLC